MNKEFIPYEQALSMEKLGFVEKCFGFYTLEGYYFPNTTLLNSLTYGCDAPLYQQAFRFLSGKIITSIKFEKDYMQGSFILLPLIYFDKYLIQVLRVPTSSFINKNGEEVPYYGEPIHVFTQECSSFAEAELACLIKLIEIAKNK